MIVEIIEHYFIFDVELALDLVSVLFLEGACDPLLELQVLAVRRLTTGDFTFNLGVSTSSLPVISASLSYKMRK